MTGKEKLVLTTTLAPAWHVPFLAFTLVASRRLSSRGVESQSADSWDDVGAGVAAVHTPVSTRLCWTQQVQLQ